MAKSQVRATSTLFIAALAVPGLAHAVSFSGGGTFIEQVGGRLLNQSGFSELRSPIDSYTLLDAQGALQEGGFALRAQPQLRGLLSDSANLPKSDPTHLTVRSFGRAVDLQTVIASEGRAEWVLDIERLDVSYSTDSGELYVGRRPLGLGILRAVPIWNKFTKPLPTVSGYPLIFNPDVAGARYQWDQFALQAVTVFGRNSEDRVFVGEAAYFGGQIEFHALGSWWWERAVVGLGATTDIAGLTLRGEALYVDLQSSTENELQGAIELEGAFSARWSGLGSLVLYSRGAFDTLEYSVESPSRFNSLRAVAYGFVQAVFKPTDPWMISLASLVNLVDFSQYALLKTSYSLTASLDVFGDLNVPLGRENAELSSRSFVFNDGSYLGLPYQLDAGVKFYF